LHCGNILYLSLSLRVQTFSVKNYERRKCMTTCTHTCYNSFKSPASNFLWPFSDSTFGGSGPKGFLTCLHYICFSIKWFSSRVSFNMSKYFLMFSSLRQSIQTFTFVKGQCTLLVHKVIIPSIRQHFITVQKTFITNPVQLWP